MEANKQIIVNKFKQELLECLNWVLKAKFFNQIVNSNVKIQFKFFFNFF